MADQPYTEADVALVARYFREERYRDPEYNARDVLADLAAAGRLLPGGASVVKVSMPATTTVTYELLPGAALGVTTDG